jgi:NTP pyrophosphatase (non-canonical NTP hydrolase)
MDLKKIQQKTVELSKGFAAHYDERDHLIDLMEEMGELAQALQISTGRKITNDPKKIRTQEDVIDGICDVMFALVRLADTRGLDLESEYMKMLSRIRIRMDEGEFKKHD